MKRNLVAHCYEGSSDKVYMVCIRDNANGTYSVLGKWGRRGVVGKGTGNNVVKASFELLNRATQYQAELFNEKLNKGYVDIDSPTYRGSVTWKDKNIIENLEKEDGFTLMEVFDKAKEDIVNATGIPEDVLNQEDTTFEVVCVDNTGIDDRFDKDVEYVAKHHKDFKMIWVYDKFGKIDEYFKDRFVNPEQLKLSFMKFREGTKVNVLNPIDKPMVHFNKKIN